MKLRLQSDFVDYYDHHFDLEGVPFKRFAKTSRTRENDLLLLRDAGFCVPWFGKVKQYSLLCNAPNVWVVVYDDLCAHCGEGKRLVRSTELAKEEPDKFCSFYVPAEQTYHVRLLAVGDWKAVLRYASDHVWMSNRGEVQVELLQYGEFCDPRLERIQHWLSEPLVAVDGRYSDAGELMAFDLNTAPGLKGSGIEDVLKPNEVVEQIKRFFERIKGKDECSVVIEN